MGFDYDLLIPLESANIFFGAGVHRCSGVFCWLLVFLPWFDPEAMLWQLSRALDELYQPGGVKDSREDIGIPRLCLGPWQLMAALLWRLLGAELADQAFYSQARGATRGTRFVGEVKWVQLDLHMPRSRQFHCTRVPDPLAGPMDLRRVVTLE